MKFEFFYGLQAEQYSFYRIPKILFQAEYFKEMSCEAKVLYGLMLDRMDLSIKNRWFDEENKVYIIFAIDDVMDKLSCAKQKAVKLVAELNSIGLIEKKRVGLGKANVIYVKNFTTGLAELSGDEADLSSQTSRSMEIKPLEVTGQNFQKCEKQTYISMGIKPQEVLAPDIQKCENQTTDGMKNMSQEVCVSYPNHTEGNNTEFINTQSYQSHQSTNGKQEAMEAYREIIYDNIGYEALCSMYPKKRVSEIAELMLDVVTSNKRTYRIAGSDMDANLVKSRFMQIGLSHVQYVLTCLDQNTTKVTNIKQYLMTVLYNSTITMAHFYQSKVQHDMYGNG